jgi:hypothetical protein
MTGYPFDYKKEEVAMDNNYGWQKQQVDERIQCALKNAATCRLSHEGSSGKSLSAIPYKAFFIPVVVVLFLVGMVLSSCIPAQPLPVVESYSQAIAQSNPPSGLAMADRIRFHDQLWDQAYSSGGVKVLQPVKSMAMAARIRFQDRVWERLHGVQPTPVPGVLRPPRVGLRFARPARNEPSAWPDPACVRSVPDGKSAYRCSPQ